MSDKAIRKKVLAHRKVLSGADHWLVCDLALEALDILALVPTCEEEDGIAPISGAAEAWLKRVREWKGKQ